MKITLENTSTLVNLVINGVDVPARIWQGEDQNGIAVHAFITRIVPEVPESDPEIETKLAAFTEELRREAHPRGTVRSYDLRFFID